MIEQLTLMGEWIVNHSLIPYPVESTLIQFMAVGCLVGIGLLSIVEPAMLRWLNRWLQKEDNE